MLDRLPDLALDPSQPLGSTFAALSIGRLRDAARWVWGLPYGRTSDRADPALVLAERRGTCSTKHALVASLAAEVGAEVRLIVGMYYMGMYNMDEANTPGVGPVLQQAGLAAIPEAHTFLRTARGAIDLTWPGRSPALPPMVSETEIQPGDIGAVKERLHREALTSWAEAAHLDAEVAWAVREACIAALADA